uniref:Uncharacterized protein n=1 Tax=Arundo donax TaxID=35708 RepID=A0A0A8ZID0_ARUDO
MVHTAFGKFSLYDLCKLISRWHNFVTTIFIGFILLPSSKCHP